MQTNKSLAVKIRDTVFGETLKSSVEERDESRQNKLETVKLTAPLPPPSLRVVLIFVYRSIYRCVKFTPPVLSADVRAETEMAVMHARKPALNSWCARTGRTTNQATLFRFPLVHRAFFFLSFLFFFFIPHALVSTLNRSKMLCSFFLPHPSNSFVVSKHCFREFEIIFFARVSSILFDNEANKIEFYARSYIVRRFIDIWNILEMYA